MEIKDLFLQRQNDHEKWLKEYCEKHNLDYVMTSLALMTAGESIARDIIGDKANT